MCLLIALALTLSRLGGTQLTALLCELLKLLVDDSCVTLKLASPIPFERLTSMPVGPTLRRSMLPSRVKASVRFRVLVTVVVLLKASERLLMWRKNLVSDTLLIHLTIRQVQVALRAKLTIRMTPGRRSTVVARVLCRILTTLSVGTLVLPTRGTCPTVMWWCRRALW